MKTKLVRPVLVESKEESYLQIRNGILYYSDKLFCANNPDMPEIGFINPNNNQQLILISLEDERIEVGDKIYHPNTGLVEVIEIERLISYSNYKFKTVDERCWICDLTNETKKVMTTQSQLSSEYIQQAISEFNNGGMKDVKIEMEEYIPDEISFGLSSINEYDAPPTEFKPKLTNGYVTIVNTMKTEEKLQQAANSHADNYYDKNDSEHFTHWCNRQSNFIAGAKSPESLEYWKEKEKLWTNEEMFELLNTFRKDFPLHRGIQIMDTDLKEWFNRYKK